MYKNEPDFSPVNLRQKANGMALTIDGQPYQIKTISKSGQFTNAVTPFTGNVSWVASDSFQQVISSGDGYNIENLIGVPLTITSIVVDVAPFSPAGTVDVELRNASNVVIQTAPAVPVPGNPTATKVTLTMTVNLVMNIAGLFKIVLSNGTGGANVVTFTPVSLPNVLPGVFQVVSPLIGLPSNGLIRQINLSWSAGGSPVNYDGQIFINWSNNIAGIPAVNQALDIITDIQNPFIPIQSTRYIFDGTTNALIQDATYNQFGTFTTSKIFANSIREANLFKQWLGNPDNFAREYSVKLFTSEMFMSPQNQIILYPMFSLANSIAGNANFMTNNQVTINAPANIIAVTSLLYLELMNQ